MLTQTNLLLFRTLFFCVYATIGVMYPFLVLHLKTGVGLNDRDVTLLCSLSGVTVILFQQMWGYAADVLVSKKWLIALTCIGSGLLFFAIGQLTRQWSIACVMFAFYALFTSVTQVVNGFLFAHRDSEKYFGVLRAWGSLGYVVANILVGVYADQFTAGKLTFIFPAFLFLSVASFLFVLPIPEARRQPADRLTFWQVQHHFLHRPEMLLFLLITFLYQAAHAPSYLLQAVLMSDMGADRATIAYSYSLAAVLELPVFFLAARLIRRIGVHWLLVFCCLVQSLRWLLVWSCSNPAEIIATSLLHCITFGVYFAAAVSFMNHHAGPHLKASAQTLYALVYQGFAAVAGNAIGSQAVSHGWLSPATRWLATRVYRVADRGDLPNLYLACSTIAGLSVLLALALRQLDKAARGVTISATLE
jgi:PPP family 3-phenylpropionic acid transporter